MAFAEVFCNCWRQILGIDAIELIGLDARIEVDI
jgi:hypothetical protein